SGSWWRGAGSGPAVTFAGRNQIIIGAPGAGKVFVLGPQRDKPVQDLQLPAAPGLGSALAALSSSALLVGSPADGGGAALEVQLDINPSKSQILAKFVKQVPIDGDDYGAAVVAAGERVVVGA